MKLLDDDDAAVGDKDVVAVVVVVAVEDVELAGSDAGSCGCVDKRREDDDDDVGIVKTEGP